MLNEKDKAAFLNGAKGITKDGQIIVLYGNQDIKNPPYRANLSFGHIQMDVLLDENLVDIEAQNVVVVGLWDRPPLTDFNIQALENGAYGVTRRGHKALVLSKFKDNGKTKYKVAICFEKDDWKLVIQNERFSFWEQEDRDDIVGLWCNRFDSASIQFNYDKALLGYPVFDMQLEKQCYLIGRSKQNSEKLIFEYENEIITIMQDKDINKRFRMV